MKTPRSARLCCGAVWSAPSAIASRYRWAASGDSLTERQPCLLSRRQLPQDIDRPGDHQSQNGERTSRLYGQRRLGPASERHHIGRAERGGIGKAEVEVVEELRTPARRRNDRVELLRERKLGGLRRSPEERIGAASVYNPVQECEGNDRVQPDTEPDAEKTGWAVRFRAALHEIRDEPDGDSRGFRDQYHHEHKGQSPDGSQPTVAVSAVGGDDGHQQQRNDRWDYPARTQAEPRRQEQRHGDRQGQCDQQRPALLDSYSSSHDLDLGYGLARSAFPLTGPPVTDDAFHLRRGGCSCSCVGFGDQGAGGVHRRGYLSLVAAGWHVDDNPGPAKIYLDLNGNPRGVCQPLIALKPLISH